MHSDTYVNAEWTFSEKGVSSFSSMAKFTICSMAPIKVHAGSFGFFTND